MIDAYDLADPVDILSKIPGTIQDDLAAPKWTDRRDALQNLQTLSQTVKLADGDYGDLVRLLKKVIAGDSNIVCVVLAASCVTNLAKSLRKRFAPYCNLVSTSH